MNDDEPIIEINELEPQKTEDRRAPVVREKLSIGLIAVIGLSIVTGIIAIAFSANAATIKDFATGAVHDLMVIFAMVVGYYFGLKHRGG